jgi:DnaJ-class molecular chaperone
MDVDELDPYRVLGVERGASVLEVGRARRRMAKRYHPDVAGQATADDRMRAVNDAWDLLTDPARRLAWDSAHPTGGSTSAGVAWPGTYPTATPVREGGSSSGAAGWWVLAAFLFMMVVLLGAGLVGSLDGPDPGIVDSPVLQHNLDRP